MLFENFEVIRNFGMNTKISNNILCYIESKRFVLLQKSKLDRQLELKDEGCSEAGQD